MEAEAAAVAEDAHHKHNHLVEELPALVVVLDAVPLRFDGQLLAEEIVLLAESQVDPDASLTESAIEDEVNGQIGHLQLFLVDLGEPKPGLVPRLLDGLGPDVLVALHRGTENFNS